MGLDAGGDRRPLLRGVGAAPAARRLHVPTARPDPRRARTRDARSHVRALGHRGAARSFMSGSTELRSGRLSVARWGPLYEAVGFSVCLPVVAPPQVRGRELFIDGSLVDNLPVRVMADMGEGPVIAVDVKPTSERPDGAPRRVGGRAAAAAPRRDPDPRAAARQRQHVRGGAPARRPRHQAARRGRRPCSSSTRSTSLARPGGWPPGRRSSRRRASCSPEQARA